jgi:antibiotic biosynthesis monooxygenase (ABM) superfamily enzyme
MDYTSPTPQAVPRKRPKWTYALLIAPYVGLCFPQLYARATPALLGFPFFYWYQLGWVVLTSLLLYVVYRQFKTAE